MTDNLCESCAHWRVNGFKAQHVCECDVNEVTPDSYKSVKVGCYAYKQVDTEDA